jgi:hypothetical protein
MWTLNNNNTILYNMVNFNVNFNMKEANGTEKPYSKNKMAVLVLPHVTVSH